MSNETRGFSVVYNIRGFGDSADHHPVILHEPNGESRQISVTEFIWEKYQIRLQFPRLPTLECVNKGAQNSSFIPIELCFVEEWQIVDRSLMNNEQNAEKSKRSILLPEVRFNKTMKIAQERNFANDSYLNHLSMVIDTKQMLQVKARVLEPPAIVYRNNRVVSVTIGKWLMKGNLLQQTTRVHKVISTRQNESNRIESIGDFSVGNGFSQRWKSRTGSYGYAEIG